VLAGDSAGGGLALSLLSLVAAEAREGTRVRPAGAAVMSPWTDLALSGASMETRAKVDPLMTKESLAAAARIYLSEHDPFDPRASPLYADLAGLPPVRIHVGEDEVLLDDSIRYGERLETAGGTVQVHTWEGMIHVFPSNIANLRAAKQALDDIGGFLRQQCESAIFSFSGQDMSPSIPRVGIPRSTVRRERIRLIVAHYFFNTFVDQASFRSSVR